MKSKQEIHDHYNKHMEFFADNRSVAFDEMLYFRTMIEDAQMFVSRQAGSPQADKWLRQYDRIVECENKNS